MKIKKNIDENDIFIAGLNEFCTKSYDEASLNRIIKNVPISKGSFYYRFKNKYDLYIFILKTCLKQKWDYIKKQIAKNPVSGTPKDIFEMFKIQARISTDFAYKYPKYHKIGIMFANEKGTKLFKHAIKDLGRNDEAGLTDLIIKAINNNEFNKRFSHNFIEKIITHLFNSFYDLFFENEEVDIEAANKHLEDYIEFMRNGLASDDK